MNTGYSNSIKVNNWNNTGVSGGYDWYCDAVRNCAWYQIDNPAGFTIDWKPSPTNLWTVLELLDPHRNKECVIGVTPEFVAVPNAEEVWDFNR